MSDWQVGDLATVVIGGEIDCGEYTHEGDNAAVGFSFEVYAVGQGSCGCVVLTWSPDHDPEFDGMLAERCRKIRPDEHEACEEEFRILLKLSKHRVSA